jgi:hypothetical protein
MAGSSPRKSTGTKRTGSAPKSTRSSASSSRRSRKFVVCLSNDGNEASLERRKIYSRIPDSSADKLGLVRVIDESGEDYLYPRQQFSEIEIPRGLAKALAR